MKKFDARHRYPRGFLTSWVIFPRLSDESILYSLFVLGIGKPGMRLEGFSHRGKHDQGQAKKVRFWGKAEPVHHDVQPRRDDTSNQAAARAEWIAFAFSIAQCLMTKTASGSINLSNLIDMNDRPTSQSFSTLPSPSCRSTNTVV